jgi:predicted nuclease of restriction endonuclease-like (RecB) superfamily
MSKHDYYGKHLEGAERMATTMSTEEKINFYINQNIAMAVAHRKEKERIREYWSNKLAESEQKYAELQASLHLDLDRGSIKNHLLLAFVFLLKRFQRRDIYEKPMDKQKTWKDRVHRFLQNFGRRRAGVRTNW